MILIDYQTISLASILVNRGQEEFDVTEDYLRHLILDSLRAITKRFRGDFGSEVVIACDAKGMYWRDDIFPHYKWKRRNKKKDDKIDWATVYKVTEMVQGELRDFFPYKVIRVPRAEADDVIAVIAKMKSKEKRNVLIVSEDKDFVQLIDQYVSIWHPRRKELLLLTRDDTPSNGIFVFGS